MHASKMMPSLMATMPTCKRMGGRATEIEGERHHRVQVVR